MARNLLPFSPATPEADRTPEGYRDSLYADNFANLRDNGTIGRDALVFDARVLGKTALMPSTIAQSVARFNAACAEVGEPLLYALAHKVEGLKNVVRLSLVTREEYEAKSAAARKAAEATE